MIWTASQAPFAPRVEIDRQRGSAGSGAGGPGPNRSSGLTRSSWRTNFQEVRAGEREG